MMLENQRLDIFDSAIATVLEGARMFCHPDLPHAVGVVELSFAFAKVFIVINAEFDTLIATPNVQEDLVRLDRLLPSVFWDPLIGKVLVAVWFMTNDRGYPDGIQLRFREHSNSGTYTTIQLNGEASQIRLDELARCRRQSMYSSV